MSISRSRSVPIVLLAALLALTACGQVKETLQSANEKMHELAGTSPQQGTDTAAPANPTDTADNDADADVQLAVRLMDGDGVARDPARAVELVRPHAEAGHAQAQFVLGLAYGSGQGIEKDRPTAVGWYRRAAAQGQADAQFLLGMALLRGDGATQDLSAATSWLEKSAQAGNAGAQYQLAIAYARGQGVERDVAVSTQWFEQAAEQGHAEAQYMAGEAYQIGRGVTKNRAWATRWFAKAALQGVADGQYMTGLAYAAGSGVPQDFATAYRWLWIAADRGSDKAGPYRDRIGDRLTEDRRAAAHATAQSWKPRGAAAATGYQDGPSVAFAQHTLDRLGYDPGAVDGIYGPKTSRAVRAYEAAKGMPVTGAISEELLKRLKDDPIHAS